MIAAKKMKDYGLKALAHDCCVDLVTVYRWVRKIESGVGVADKTKSAIMAATAKSPHAIAWVDFAPEAGHAR